MDRFLILCSSLLAVMPAFGTTYYVDFTAGNNANGGTSKAAPWQHAPGMPGCTGNCASHNVVAGDGFIFHGGVTWPATAMPLTVPANGANGNPVYFGVDTTWYTGTNSGTVNTNGTTVYWVSGKAFYQGGAWDGGSIRINGISYTIATVLSPSALTLTTSAGTQSGVPYNNSSFVRPVFDGQGVATNLFNTSKYYITLEGIEFTGLYASNSTTGQSIGGGSSGGNFLMKHLDVHNWTKASNITDNSGSLGGIYISLFGGLNGSGIELDYSNVGNPENGGNIGVCTRGVQTLIGNNLHDCSQACLHGCQNVHDNVIKNVGNTFDGVTHTNGIYADCFDGQCASGLTTATAYIYNNWIVDMQGNAAATIIYPNPGSSGVSSSVTYYVFNNVISCAPANGCDSTIADEIDPYNAPSTLQMYVYDWNNTYNLVASGICVNTVTRTYPLKIVDVRNLDCIVPSGGTTFNPGSASSPNSVDLLLRSTATANSQGYSAPYWSPTVASGPTVGTGTNLTSQCAGALVALCSDTSLGGTRIPVARPTGVAAWDEGAYKYNTGSQGTVAPPTGLSSVVH
jgi:hypothetical protein